MNNISLRTFIATTLALPSILIFASTSLADIRDFSFNNKTDGVINRLYISSSDKETWGQDILQGEVILPGDSVDLAINEGNDCIHDLRAQFQNGNIVEVKDLNLCEIREYSFYQ